MTSKIYEVILQFIRSEFTYIITQTVNIVKKQFFNISYTGIAEWIFKVFILVFDICYGNINYIENGK